jgi:uncharacterized membrane protein YfcA
LTVNLAKRLLPVVGVGIAAGLLAGFFGVGGGIIMVPLLVWLLRFDQHTAHATSLAAIFIIAISGAVSFAVSGQVNVRLALALGAGGVVGSTLGAHTLHRLSEKSLKMAFALVLLVAGVRLLLAVVPIADSVPTFAGFLLGAVIGAVAGFASGVAGVGGGVVMIPAMVVFLNISQHTAEGTSLLAILFTSAAATRVNLKNRRVQASSAVIMGLAGAMTAPLGTRLALGLDVSLLQRLFAAFVLITALRMLWKLRQG